MLAHIAPNLDDASVVAFALASGETLAAVWFWRDGAVCRGVASLAQIERELDAVSEFDYEADVRRRSPSPLCSDSE